MERVDQQHVKYFLDLKPGKKQTVQYSVTYKRRKVGPELNIEKKREPLNANMHTAADATGWTQRAGDVKGSVP